MIKATELRTGNYIIDIQSVQIPRMGIRSTGIIQVKAQGISYIDMSEQFAAYYEPIPLTEEWLLKLGFTIRSTSDWWTNYLTSDKKFMISKCNQDSPEAGAIVGKFYWGDICKEIEFVHRLQNLVYELTDKELVVIN